MVAVPPPPKKKQTKPMPLCIANKPSNGRLPEPACLYPASSAPAGSFGSPARHSPAPSPFVAWPLLAPPRHLQGLLLPSAAAGAALESHHLFRFLGLPFEAGIAACCPCCCGCFCCFFFWRGIDCWRGEREEAACGARWGAAWRRESSEWKERKRGAEGKFLCTMQQQKQYQPPPYSRGHSPSFQCFPS